MPGTVYRGRSAEPAGVWTDGALKDADGVGTLLARKGAEWFPGKSATPAWRTRGNLLFKGPSSEPWCRISGEAVYRGNTSEVLYRLRGDAILRAAGADPVVRGAGLTAEELLLAALTLDPPR
ncbi:MAG: hypothetical protein ACOZNI_31325 [Myxococcota bacterium]